MEASDNVRDLGGGAGGRGGSSAAAAAAAAAPDVGDSSELSSMSDSILRKIRSSSSFQGSVKSSKSAASSALLSLVKRQTEMVASFSESDAGTDRKEIERILSENRRMEEELRRTTAKRGSAAPHAQDSGAAGTASAPESRQGSSGSASAPLPKAGVSGTWVPFTSVTAFPVAPTPPLTPSTSSSPETGRERRGGTPPAQVPTARQALSERTGRSLLSVTNVQGVEGVEAQVLPPPSSALHSSPPTATATALGAGYPPHWDKDNDASMPWGAPSVMGKFEGTHVVGIPSSAAAVATIAPATTHGEDFSVAFSSVAPSGMPSPSPAHMTLPFGNTSDKDRTDDVGAYGPERRRSNSDSRSHSRKRSSSFSPLKDVQNKSQKPTHSQRPEQAAGSTSDYNRKGVSFKDFGSHGGKRRGDGKGGRDGAGEDDDFEPPLKVATKSETCMGRFWYRFSRFVTILLPDFVICKAGAPAKQAWREKVAICFLVFLASVVIVGGIGFVPLLFCQKQYSQTWDDINNRATGRLAFSTDSWTVVHGNVYDVSSLGHGRAGTDTLKSYIGRDAGNLFPRTPPADLPPVCLNLAEEKHRAVVKNMTKPICPALAIHNQNTDGKPPPPCHDFAAGPEGVHAFLGPFRAGTLAHSHDSLHTKRYEMTYLIVDQVVYNITNYIDGLKDENKNIVKDHPNGYLNEKLHKLIVNKFNSDGTEVFWSFYEDDPQEAQIALMCMDRLFYEGKIDQIDNEACYVLNIVMYVLICFVALLLVLQLLCSLLYVTRTKRALTKEMASSKVMVMVPCYNEGYKELGKTIKSVLDTNYPDSNKVLFVVADGLITGHGEDRSTPDTIADLLGYIPTSADRSHRYSSIGANSRNRAYVYHGVHEKNGRELKYVVVIKCGTSRERRGGNARAGNRGKRDSQLILAGMLNRVHYGRRPCELDLAICRALDELDVSIEDLKYLMTIDADTRVHRESMAQMVAAMEKERNVLACCGETRVDNKAQSWVTAIQVYEYYSSHHMKKAFESAFGAVTCLPGCFTMYRIKCPDSRPLIACDSVYGNYARNDIDSLHEKNLYHLGEDRMLTTLLLQHFHDMKLSFVPEAVCWTIVPHKFRILVSQRRRWINSTFHNMWELLKVHSMCGVCLFSMKTVVIADMIATMILPASLVYSGYFIYLVFGEGEPINQTVFFSYGIIIGCQLLVFMVRARWDYFLWFFAYIIVGLPIFYFILPIYAFWHMDDLSWGQTRRVEASAAQEKRIDHNSDEAGFEDEAI